MSKDNNEYKEYDKFKEEGEKDYGTKDFEDEEGTMEDGKPSMNEMSSIEGEVEGGIESYNGKSATLTTSNVEVMKNLKTTREFLDSYSKPLIKIINNMDKVIDKEEMKVGKLIVEKSKFQDEMDELIVAMTKDPSTEGEIVPKLELLEENIAEVLHNIDLENDSLESIVLNNKNILDLFKVDDLIEYDNLKVTRVILQKKGELIGLGKEITENIIEQKDNLTTESFVSTIGKVIENRKEGKLGDVLEFIVGFSMGERWSKDELATKYLSVLKSGFEPTDIAEGEPFIKVIATTVVNDKNSDKSAQEKIDGQLESVVLYSEIEDNNDYGELLTKGSDSIIKRIIGEREDIFQVAFIENSESFLKKMVQPILDNNNITKETLDLLEILVERLSVIKEEKEIEQVKAVVKESKVGGVKTQQPTLF